MSQKISQNPVPSHVAIVPDGNRRWAKRKGLKPWQGHEEGAKLIEDLSREALKAGVKYITFWGSSVDNLTKRPFSEKRELLRIYEKYFKKLISSKEIFDNGTRINIFGRWEEQFPNRLKKILKEGIEKTRNHANSFMTFLLAYSGDDEMLEAAKRIAHKFCEEKVKINEQEFKKSLLTGDLPAVDLLIRTGVEGDPHNSAGFMMWQTRDSQYYFSNKMFPDFNTNELKKALDDFSNRVRRFGK